MDSSIIDYISQFVKLTDDEAEILSSQNLFRQYEKNEILLAEGKYAKVCYFIIKGCVRSYYIKDGEERNTDFFFENQTIRPVSYQTKQPSEYYLSCLEECIVAIGDEARNRKLVEQIPKLFSLVAKMNEELLLQKQLELDHFKNNNPEERYLNLLENKPEFLDRIPLYHLASYLGITQVSLSRIRSRILNR
ncbi:MAG: Crp/Fnr family transcriptional regulator [Bernardetiaceae bacterium]|jgi:CRP-like cAMP-binding protein|nr:Crp/Fnr family transcriptional regulator [Bernardetiaceae bacterium]